MMRNACRRVAAVGLVLLAGGLLPARQAHALISAASVAASGCSGNGNNADGSTTCEFATVTNNGTNLNTRYGFNVNADVGLFGDRTQSGTATHRVSFNSTAVGGYRLDITTSRVGDLNRVNDLLGCNGQADTSGVAGSALPGLSTGTITLADPGVLGNGDSTTSIPFSQSTATATILGVSNGVAQAHNFTFTFTASTRSNSCEAAVRTGAQNGTTTSCTACVYAGSPARTQATDGHFVNITFVNLCGNGVIDASVGEQCDLGAGNGQGGTCCTSNCQLRASGQTCRLATDGCDQAETCTGSGANCPADIFLPLGTVCRAGSAGEVCDENETCTGGSPACPADQVKPFGTPCRGLQGECDVVENCDGVAKFCPIDSKQPNGTSCTSDGNPCSLDACNGTSNLCQHPAGNAGAVCRPAAGVCDAVETCTGASTTCPVDGFLGLATVCRPAVDVCDIQENCFIGPDCPADIVRLTTFVCRPSAGVCDVADTCDGVTTACTADDKQPNGTSCGSDSNPCTLDQCDGVNNACQHPAGNSGALCRASAGECDVAETCDGGNTACPPDDKQPGGTPCTDDGNVCSLDECDGASDTCQHPAGNAGVTCRSVSIGDVCDEEEQCDGSSTTCPADGVVAAGTECRPQNGICDVAEQCDGVAKQCPADGVASNSTPCRASAGVCDVAENCDGTNSTCPVDGFATSGVCRVSAGVCDLADSCDGSGANCPADDKSTAPCRPSAGLCDVVESCDGVGDDCPADGFANSGTCRPIAGLCDVAESCNGSGVNCPADLFEPNTTECRADAGQCDLPESCTGSSAACPVDGFESDGTTCNDGDICTGGEQCISGVCGGGSSTCELDHYKCYQGRDLKTPKFAKRTVSTTDQIATSQSVEVKKLKFVCAPVDKNGEGINNPNAHLACYQLKAPTLAPRPSVEVSTQFQTSRFQLKKGKLICLPATKTVLP